MGSITKRPVAPPVRQVRRPIATIREPEGSSSGGSNESSQETIKKAETARVVSREKSLLRRSRGVLGTILTGFQGVLNKTSQDNKKTLLGE